MSLYDRLRRRTEAPSQVRMDSLRERFGVRADGDFDESKIERDESGRFVETGADGEASDDVAKKLSARIQRAHDLEWRAWGRGNGRSKAFWNRTKKRLMSDLEKLLKKEKK